MLVGKGTALYAGGFYDQAASYLCAVSDLKPADSTPYLFLGKMEETAPAPLPCVAEKMARFAQNQPENALAHYYYAMSLLKGAKESDNSAIGQPAEALLEKAVTIDPKLAEAYLQLGILYFERGDYAAAIRAYQNAIEVSPKLGSAHYRLALAYKRVGEDAKAQQEFQMHQQIEKTEAADVERQRREMQQFLIVLKDQPPSTQKK
jgi:tetratricopeptide (TPR) repeat protein